MTTSDDDAAMTAKEHFANATNALNNSAPESNSRPHSVEHLADHASVEIDKAKQHAISAIDTTLQSATTAAEKARITYQRNPKKTLATIGAVAVGLLALVTLLRRL